MRVSPVANRCSVSVRKVTCTSSAASDEASVSDEAVSVAPVDESVEAGSLDACTSVSFVSSRLSIDETTGSEEDAPCSSLVFVTLSACATTIAYEKHGPDVSRKTSKVVKNRFTLSLLS